MKTILKKLLAIAMAASMVPGLFSTVYADPVLPGGHGESGVDLPEDPMSGVDRIEITSVPSHIYYIGEADFFHEEDGVMCIDPFEVRDLAFRIYFTDGTFADYTPDDVVDGMIDGYDVELHYERENPQVGDLEVELVYRGASATYTVEIAESPVDHIVIDTAPTRDYFYGESECFRMEDGTMRFDPWDMEGLVFTVYYTDNTSRTFSHEDADEGEVYDGVELRKIFNDEDFIIGENYVEIEFLGKRTGYNVTVIQSPVDHIVIDTAPDYVYILGDAEFFREENGGVWFDPWELHGIAFTVYYTDGTQESFTWEDSGEHDFYGGHQLRRNFRGDEYVVGANTVTVEYMGKTATYTVTVVDSPLDRIEIDSAPSYEYIYGESRFFHMEDGELRFDPWEKYGLAFTAYYKDGTSKSFTWEDDVEGKFDGYEIRMLYDNRVFSIGKNTISLSYLGKTAQYQITVVESPVDHLVVTKAPGRVYYYNDMDFYRYENGRLRFDPWDTDGLEFTVFFKDGTSKNYKWEDNVDGMLDGIQVNRLYDGEGTVGTHEITFEYYGVPGTYNVTVVESPVDSIEVDHAPIFTYYAGMDQFFEYENDVPFRFHPWELYGLQFTVYFKDGTVRSYSYQDIEEGGTIDGERFSLICDSENFTFGEPFHVELDYMGKLDGYDVELLPSETHSGTCGANVTWRFEDGDLNISGNGAIRNYNSSTDLAPWASFRTRINNIYTDDGITRIGNSAFYGCSNAKWIWLGEGVLTIGVNAFSGCSGIDFIDLDGALTQIDNYAFNNCSSLKMVEFHNRQTPVLGANAFANTKVDAVYYDTWEGFEKGNFGGKTTWLIDHIGGSCGATRFSLDRGVLTISGKGTIRGYSRGEAPWYAYRDEIRKVVIGDGVTSIGNYAFYGCENLTEIEFGSGVTSLGTSSFYGCTSLGSVTFPASLTTIGAYAFSNCTGITELEFTGEAAPAIANTGLNAVKAKAVYPEGQSWDDFAKNGYGGAIYWTDDPTEQIIGGSCGNKAAWMLIDGTLTIYGQGGTKGYSSKTQVPWYDYREEITRIVVEDGITSLGNYQFMGCENVTEVYLSNTLRKICVNAFSTCRSLTSVTIPETVTDIYAYAFNKCSALQQVIFEGDRNAVEINGHAFENTAIK